MTTLQEAIDAISFTIDPVPDPINDDSNVDAAWQFTYQFASTQPGDLWDTYTGWRTQSAAEQQQIRDLLNYVETIVNVDFVEVNGQVDPDMNIGSVDMAPTTAGIGGFGYSYAIPGGQPAYITEWDNFSVFNNTIDLVGELALILHEVGHALGLKHPFSGTPTLPANLDNNKYTLMSYTVNPDNGMDSEALMIYDIAALQARWGANLTTATGNNIYTGPTNSTVDTIWDAGGVDVLNASTYLTSVVLDLNEGAFSQFGAWDDVAIAYGSVIENAVGGSGNDLLTGNAFDNSLQGGAGDDTINGGGGNDTADFSDALGAMTLNLSAPTVTALGLGTDTLVSIENAIAGPGNDIIFGTAGNNTLFGGAGSDQMSGLGGDDTLYGEAGNDTLFGGTDMDFMFGGAGQDLLNGQGGDDEMHGGDNGDQLFGDAGNDLMFGDAQSDIMKGHTGNDTMNGGADADFMFGESDDDILNGDGGNDILLGGSGNDIVNGGVGDDTLFGQEGIDILNGGDGDDGLFSGADADTLNGENGADQVYGQAGNDILNGGAGSDFLAGGTENDILDGGTGNDTLNSGSGADILVFGLGYEFDIVQGFENNVDTLEFDEALWGGGLTPAQVLANFATQFAAGVVEFNFGLGDVLHVNQNGLTVADLSDDITITGGGGGIDGMIFV